jgi:hypothetical protein
VATDGAPDYCFDFILRSNILNYFHCASGAAPQQGVAAPDGALKTLSVHSALSVHCALCLSVASNYLSNKYSTNDNLYLTITDNVNAQISEYNNLIYIDSLPIVFLFVLAKQ